MDDIETAEQPTPPAPEPAAPPPPAPTAPEAAPALAPDPEALAALAEKAATQRLPAAEEEKAAQLVRAAVLAGDESVVPVLPKLGWAASSRGVAAAWADLKATSRTAFLKALAEDESEAGRRIRLSLARGLFKVPDLPATAKLVVGVCKELRDKKTGELQPRDAQNFAAVMIGKGKPWIAQLALADLKPADAALLVHCALIATFSVGGPPVTPLGVLKWAADAGQLAELHEAALAAVTAGVARWSPKWADVLRKEVPNAPEPILAALRTAPPAPEPTEAAPADVSTEPAEEDDGLPGELKEAESDSDGETPRSRPVYVSKTIPPREQRPQQPQPPQQPQQPQQPSQQPQREPRGPGAKSVQFNVNEALRQIESHISWLKNELQFAEKKLRSRDDDRREVRRKPEVPVIAGEPTPDELARLNVQLEARITELQSRIDDLTSDAEARAASAGVFSGEQPAPDAQLRTLLGLKLAEHYADFAALEQEDRDLVIPAHYRTVLAEVFAVLKAEGVPLELPMDSA